MLLEDWLFHSEYPMIRWLERNGYDVSYTTDMDMDRDALVITPSIHKILLSAGHDEYWSAAERLKFETARNNRVRLFSVAMKYTGRQDGRTVMVHWFAIRKERRKIYVAVNVTRCRMYGQDCGGMGVLSLRPMGVTLRIH